MFLYKKGKEESFYTEYRKLENFYTENGKGIDYFNAERKE
jgi:hypothetical protein